MPRRANISISFLTLHNKELSMFVLRDLLNALPSDTTIFGFYTDYLTNSGNIFVDSSAFIDTPASTMLPEIIVNLKKSPSGVVSFDSLDMSAALQNYQTTPQPQQQNPCGCMSFMCGICNPVNLSVPNNFTVSSSGTTQKRVGYPAGVAGSFSLAGLNTAGFTGGCNHEWKIYDSGFSRKEYCSKCNIDKT